MPQYAINVILAQSSAQHVSGLFLRLNNVYVFFTCVQVSKFDKKDAAEENNVSNGTKAGKNWRHIISSQRKGPLQSSL